MNGFDNMIIDWTADVDLSMKSFQVLGACSSRGYVDDWIRMGMPLAVNVRGDDVWVMRSVGKKIGMFPPKIATGYLSLSEKERYQYMIVVRDVNLTDKYGQYFVQPFMSR